MNALMLALFGAVCWGIAPVFGKLGLKGVHPFDGLAARTMITFLLVGLWVFGTNGLDRLEAIPAKRWIFLSIEAFLATFAGDLAYYAAIKWGKVSQTGIVLAASPLFTVWAGWYMLNESLNTTTIAGAALIVLGVILVSLS